MIAWKAELSVFGGRSVYMHLVYGTMMNMHGFTWNMEYGFTDLTIDK